MVTPDKEASKLYLFEIPAEISEFTDAKIQAWAEKVSVQWAEMLSEESVPTLKDETAIEENESGSNHFQGRSFVF